MIFKVKNGIPIYSMRYLLICFLTFCVTTGLYSQGIILYPVTSISNYRPFGPGHYMDTMCIGDTAIIKFDTIGVWRSGFTTLYYDWSDLYRIFELIGPTNQIEVKVVAWSSVSGLAMYTPPLYAKVSGIHKDRTIIENLSWTGVNLISVPCKPKAYIATSATTYCNGDTVSVSAIYQRNPTSWQWSFPGGIPATYSGPTPPAIHYTQPGVYPVSLTVGNAKGVFSTYTSNAVTVSATPQGEGRWSGRLCRIGEVVALRPCLSANDYDWYDESGTLLCAGCLAYSHTVTHTQNLTCVAYNGNTNCQKTCSYTLLVNAEPDQIFVPNAFSPNNDGTNDVFEIRPVNVSLLRMEIYDRWGSLVFENDKPAQLFWDGKLDGLELPSGVYVYKLVYQRLYDNSTDIQYGDITLIR